MRRFTAILAFSVCCLLAPGYLSAQGGCGSVCLPLESIDPERPQLRNQQLRIFTTTEYGRFDNFREGGESVTNPGGNEATISLTTNFFDYALFDRFTASFLVPYVHKVQKTNRFGKRVASGFGDVSLFGRFEVVAPELRNDLSLSVGLGVKFPTGSIEEPQTDQGRLPPPFQVGSGAYDLIPTVSYYQNFLKFSLFGSSFVRIPLEENKFGYRFGREYEFHFGLQYPLPFWGRRVELLGSIDTLIGEHDTDSEQMLPGRLREGTKVLNTGGRFLDLTPGVRVRLTQEFAVQGRVFLPVVERWHGLRARNVGQVSPDVTFQLSVAYRFNLNQF